jgi:DNA-binding MarR family transcriptional regulator
MPAARITELVTLDKAAISRAVAGLIKRGLADRKLRPASGVIHVVLTAAGAETYRAMLREMQKLQHQLFKNVQKPDRAMLFDILDKIEVALRENNDSSPAGRKKSRVSGKARAAGKVEGAR